ncbi:MAG TPA: hypothetical protein DEB39_02675 [Planctomycetaceae bacterium]|nr:hypothetical protein [Planctomycetaceae bacterium]
MKPFAPFLVSAIVCLCVLPLEAQVVSGQVIDGHVVGGVGGLDISEKGVPVKTSSQADHAALSRFMQTYQTEVAALAKTANLAWWEASTTGTDAAFKSAAEASLAISTYHSDPVQYAEIKRLRAASLEPGQILTSDNEDAYHSEQRLKGMSVDARAAELAELAYERNQLPPALLAQMTEMSSELEQIFQTQRCVIDGQEYTNNDLLEWLERETDSAVRQKIWEALKVVGEEVNDRLVALAKVRNAAAKQLGYDNYWLMSVRFQEYKAEELLAIFEELETSTRPLFAEMKKEMDAELAAKFGVAADRLMPWHYDNPFFQQAPPSKEVNPNDFYKDKTGRDIRDISVAYYESIGLPEIRDILEKSSLFEQPGKSQHAFSIDIDAQGDTRILCNLKPTVEWMDTQLHELGHSLYSYHCDRSLPFNLRDAAHIFTTEGVAMYFGAKARTPDWMVRFAGADPKTAEAVAEALKKQRRREQLIFCRWTLVMLHFEKALYENPDADLRTLWWDTVEKYQMLRRPPRRNKADWASKPHFTVAPVYYHNYMLGELFGAQIRKTIGEKEGPELGRTLIDNIFKPGASLAWPEFVRQATGEPLSTRAFAEELK